MKIYFKDKVANRQWTGFRFTVVTKKKFKPSFQIEVNHPNSLTLMLNSKVLCWAKYPSYYAGIALLKAFPKIDLDEMLIKPIHSQEIEKGKVLKDEEQLQFWAKYFLHELSSTQTFLYAGEWELNVHHMDEKRKHYLQRGEGDTCSLHNLENTLRNDALTWIDWIVYDKSNEGSVISLKQLDLEEGRLKWWRKKVKENTAPPVLIYFISALDAYVIIDGHFRLKASYLEGKSPEFFSISLVRTEPLEVDLKKQQNVENQIKMKKGIPQEQVNNMLISAYKNSFSSNAHTHAIQNPNRKWIKEVIEHLHLIGQEEYVQNFFDAKLENYKYLND